MGIGDFKVQVGSSVTRGRYYVTYVRVLEAEEMPPFVREFYCKFEYITQLDEIVKLKASVKNVQK